MLADQNRIVHRILDILHTVPVHLLTQIVKQCLELRITGCLIDDIMKTDIRFRNLLHITGSCARLKQILRIHQALQLLVRNLLAGDAYRKLVQSLTDLQHILHILERHLRNFCSLARHCDGKSLLFKHTDGLTDRRTAYPKFRGKLQFHQTLAGLQIPF